AAAFAMLTDEASVKEVSTKVLGILLLVGSLPQVRNPKYVYSSNRSTQASSGATPRSMLHVQGTSKAALEGLLTEFNQSQPSPATHAYLAVINSYDQYVVAATVMSAVKLGDFIAARSAQPDEDQSKVPFNKRRPVITTGFVDITVPYHSPLLEDAVEEILSIAQEKGWVLDAAAMQIPVRACDDGHDIRSEADLTRYLVESICVLPVDWPQTVSVPGATHIVDFGTGEFGGFAQLAHKNLEGRGVAVICAGALLPQPLHTNLGTRADLFQNELGHVITAPNWLAEFGPRLVRTVHDGKVHIDTRLTRTLGMTTVMVAGMTPTTGNVELVRAVSSAGYHIEFAGGTIHSEKDMVDKVRALAASLEPGQGITVNCIYINPRQWAFQYPAILRLRGEGVPITGLCIGGGAPTLDTALEIIGELRAAGIGHVAFKPSNARAIRHVVRIAQAAGGFPVVLQWTGGRAGGHHSYEDFHQPILETYAAIRACKNVALVAGSGFGDAAGSLPYMTGEWSACFGRAPMPFDGILLGSRIMVAKEAGTSLAAKELIVATAGLPDSEWDKTYDGEHGGFITVTSEYGELNHVLATRGQLFVRDMHRTILAHPRDKQPALLHARKDEIIARLNSDYARPWFGRKSDGRVVDLEDMTYTEVIARMIELMYVKHQQRWIHPSHHQAVMEFIDRVERRMAETIPDVPLALELTNASPPSLASLVANDYPGAETQVITSEDVQFFIGLCKRRGQKPFPFVPVLDADFGVLLLKNTYWQSEDLDTVIDGDPQRVMIQQGPVAAQYSTTVNEPVKDILDGVYHGHIASLVDSLHGGDESSIPAVQYVGADPAPVALPAVVRMEQSESERVYWLPQDEDKLPELDEWLQALAGPRKSWLRALLTTPQIVQGTTYAENHARQLMRPRPGRRVAVAVADGLPVSVEIADAAGFQELELTCGSDRTIRLAIHHATIHGPIASLPMVFTYNPSQVTALIHGSKQADDDAVRRIFTDVWTASADKLTTFQDMKRPGDTVYDEITITASHLRGLCEIIGRNSWQYACPDDGNLVAPMEFLGTAAMRPILSVFQSTIFGPGAAHVVHHSNRLEIADGVSTLHVGDTISSAVRIDGLEDTPAGKKLTVTSVMRRNGQRAGSMKSVLVSRSHHMEASSAFAIDREHEVTIALPSAADVTVLESREWFAYRDGAPSRIEPGMEVEFCLDSEYRFASDDLYSSVVTTGTVSVKTRSGRSVHIADVDFQWGAATKNPVLEYLNRHRVADSRCLFEDGGYLMKTAANATSTLIHTASSNATYARYSLDCNPVHTNPYVADYAKLPGMITHGSWTSAATASIVEAIAAGGQPERIRAFQTKFTGMVFPGYKLATELRHVGMKNGRMLIGGQTSKVGGGPVMEFEVEVEQAPTAYVFTGQGAQEVGMGMGLYAQSAAARAVWDHAKRHMLSTYGVDLLDIVRTNPTECTVYFHGKAGERIQDNYMALARHVPDKASVSGFRSVPIIPEISAQSRSHTFRSPTGLLNATQFTQVVLVVCAMAAVADMRANGLVQRDAMFAGHSLGEYCALAAIADLLTVEEVVDLVFYRGLLMQSAVVRDGQGRSDYGMVAVDPSRVARGFGGDQLRSVVDTIRAASPGLLQIANYNVHGRQYVAAGTLANLAALRLALDALAASGIPASDDIKAHVAGVVGKVLAGPVGTEAVRGKATIPLQGIDVPFHSQLLMDGVSAFRAALQVKLTTDTVSPANLHKRYIPNLTAVPFEVTRKYFELVLARTGSPVARAALDAWSDAALEDPSEKARLTVDLLVELLAYQFASPVQWIQTQDCLIKGANVERLVEVGPAPVLSGMAASTLRAPELAQQKVALLHFERDHDELYYRHMHDEPETAAPEAAEPVPTPPAEQPSKAEPLPAAPEPAPAAQASSPTGAGEPIADVPLQALEVVEALVAYKLKQRLPNGPVRQTIKALVGGKSTLQNEIVGDLQKEFGGKVPDRPEEVPLPDLGAAIGVAGALGKCTQPLVTRLFSSKMPGGFSLSVVSGILQSAYGLGPQRQDAVLLVALTMEPAARLASEADARAWLDDAAKAYAARAGISYAATAASGGAAAGGAAQGPVVSSAEVAKMQQAQREHARQQMAVLARQAGVDLRADARTAESEKARADELQAGLDGLSAELGDDYVEGIKPVFDALKARRFDSYWNWARQDAYVWIQQAIAGGDAVADDEARVLQLQNCADDKLLKQLDGTVSALSAGEAPELAAALCLATRLRDACKQALASHPVYRELLVPTQPQTSISSTGSTSYSEVPRAGEPSLTDYIEHMKEATDGQVPLLHMREKSESNQWTYSPLLSEEYYRGLAELAATGTSYAGATALVTGCGRGSIGAEIVRALLMGGARVVATTSSYSRKTMLFFEDLYRRHGARGSELVVVPFNQGSAQDVTALAEYVLGTTGGGLGWSLDYVFPFAAMPDVGSLATNLGSRSELVQRAMLTNVVRLMGAIKSAKESMERAPRPSLVVLPLSPNHGTIGGDGLYGECKIALETTFNRWASEGWDGYLSIAGAVIGWTRGTGLMTTGNLIAQNIEATGIRTFSAREMALNILALLCRPILRLAHRNPVYVDISGGMGQVKCFSDVFKGALAPVVQKSTVGHLMAWEDALTSRLQHPTAPPVMTMPQDRSPLAKHQHHFPAARDYDSLAHLHHLQDMVNLDKVVVVTGYAEVSPYGNAETRWEIEAHGEFSVAGCIELAWIMGLIRHVNDQDYIGWVDIKSGEPISDVDVKGRYEEYILSHTGIRLIEPDLALGYDTDKKHVLREVQIEHDMAPFEASADDAAAYKKSNGDCVDVWENAGGASWSVRFLKGALVHVPAAADAVAMVGGMLPTGWIGGRFGIPEDTLRQVDPVTLYGLVATVEALVRSGITDPYELYQHIHVSEIGNTMGSSIGGLQSVQNMCRHRYLDKDVPMDSLQETFISTVQAWVNMLLISGAGPVKPSVGACATAVLSVDTAVDAIMAGKAKVMLAGAVDDISEESSTEMLSMGALSNNVEEMARGREPSEMCRPCTSARTGFTEAQGASVAVLMSASTAIACGAPIYGIVGLSTTATDKHGRSVPAPGKGILTSAREVVGAAPPRQLSAEFRRGEFERQLRQLDAWKAEGLEQAADEDMAYKAYVEEEYVRQRKALQDLWSNEFWKRNPSISPLRGSLAVWGLAADDIGLASFHGTSTKANELNESEVVDAQMRQLGRTPGYPVPAVCQKWLTGHPKGPASGWMLNGVLQCLRTGLIPGNRNADNIDSKLKKYDQVVYLSKTVQTAGIKAALLKSFGFGQVGGELLVVHPEYLLATLRRAQLDEYNAKLAQRDAKAARYWQDTLVGNHPFVQVKQHPPFTPEQEQRVYLDPTARAHYDPKTNEYRF
ncbi:fatty acid synthase alpha subunit Lsd1, partial [Coemansia nantahalensis]